MKKPDYSLVLRMMQLQDDGDMLVNSIIEALLSDDIDKDALRIIAGMFKPKGPGKFQLKLRRRPGNRDQRGVDWINRLVEFKDLLDANGGNEVETVRQAELPKSEGGLGISIPTARKYLAALKASRKANTP